MAGEDELKSLSAFCLAQQQQGFNKIKIYRETFNCLRFKNNLGTFGLLKSLRVLRGPETI